MIVKAVIPAAGLGTRFLPATKATPKEMLPLIDKPAIQYAVEEAMSAGIKNIVMVTGSNKRAVEDHFEAAPLLQQTLESRQKQGLLKEINTILKNVDFSYVRQSEQLGLGHAVWTARHAVGNQHVAIMLPDDIITGSTPGIGQLIKIARQEKCNVVAVREVPVDQVSNYGVISIKKQFSPNLFQIKELVEKPSLEVAPSNLAIVGRYVLSPTIFEMLGQTEPGAIGEIQLTDAIQKLIFAGEKVFAYKVQGDHYDVGNPLGWLKANLTLALKHPVYGAAMLDYLQEIDRDMLFIQGKAEALTRQV